MCTYNSKWYEEFDWVTPVENDSDKVYCTECRCTLNIKFSGKFALTQHEARNKHQKNVKKRISEINNACATTSDRSDIDRDITAEPRASTSRSTDLQVVSEPAGNKHQENMEIRTSENNDACGTAHDTLQHMIDMRHCGSDIDGDITTEPQASTSRCNDSQVFSEPIGIPHIELTDILKSNSRAVIGESLPEELTGRVKSSEGVYSSDSDDSSDLPSPPNEMYPDPPENAFEEQVNDSTRFEASSLRSQPLATPEYYNEHLRTISTCFFASTASQRKAAEICEAEAVTPARSVDINQIYVAELQKELSETGLGDTEMELQHSERSHPSENVSTKSPQCESLGKEKHALSTDRPRSKTEANDHGRDSPLTSGCRYSEGSAGCSSDSPQLVIRSDKPHLLNELNRYFERFDEAKRIYEVTCQSIAEDFEKFLNAWFYNDFDNSSFMSSYATPWLCLNLLRTIIEKKSGAEGLYSGSSRTKPDDSDTDRHDVKRNERLRKRRKRSLSRSSNPDEKRHKPNTSTNQRQ